MAVDPELQQRREQVILEHMRSENEHRFDDTIATFAHPRTRVSRQASPASAQRRG